MSELFLLEMLRGYICCGQETEFPNTFV